MCSSGHRPVATTPATTPITTPSSDGCPTESALQRRRASLRPRRIAALAIWWPAKARSESPVPTAQLARWLGSGERPYRHVEGTSAGTALCRKRVPSLPWHDERGVTTGLGVAAPHLIGLSADG